MFSYRNRVVPSSCDEGVGYWLGPTGASLDGCVFKNHGQPVAPSFCEWNYCLKQSGSKPQIFLSVWFCGFAVWAWLSAGWFLGSCLGSTIHLWPDLSQLGISSLGLAAHHGWSWAWPRHVSLIICRSEQAIHRADALWRVSIVSAEDGENLCATCPKPARWTSDVLYWQNNVTTATQSHSTWRG